MSLSPALLRDAITIFQGIVTEAIPFLLLGVAASAFVHVYIKGETLLKLIPKSRFGSIIVGPMMGFLFPVCECGNIPLARRMLNKGVPVHTVVAFLFAAPVFNPIVILATYAAFSNQPMIVFWRVVLSLAIALIVSFFVSLIKDQNSLLNQSFRNQAPSKKECECALDQVPGRDKFKRFTTNMVSEFVELGGLLVLGSLIASFSQVVFSREAITALGQGPVSSVVAMMLLAAVISVCSNVDAFFVLSYVNSFSTGSILAFLVFGPMIDIRVLTMLPKLFRPRTILYLTLIIAQLVFLITVFYNLNLS